MTGVLIRGSTSTSVGTPRQLKAAWGLLLLNTLGYTNVATVVPLPRLLTQAVTMAALVLAFGLAVLLNQRLQVQRSPFLMLLTLVVLVSVASSLRLESGLGALFRCGRAVVFVATLWLLSRWWAAGLDLVRYHVRWLVVVLLTVVVGLAVSPDLARPHVYEGRLVGAVWPIPPTQVGQYAAVVTGLTFLLWATHHTDRRSALCIMPPAVAVLLLTHTRTALAGLLVGVTAALLSLVLSDARARRVLAAVFGAVAVAAVASSQVLAEWLARGQDTQMLNSLTGRQKVWDALLAEERSPVEALLGVGLTNKSFGGLPIDSAWLAVYYEQGYIGMALVAAMLASLLIAACLRPPSPGRACAVFLIVYCLVASYTEVGLGDASPYLLHLTVAAALLTANVPPRSVGVSSGELR